MKLQRFNGSTTQNAMSKVQESFGIDAWIYSTAKIPGGVEILAGIPEDPQDSLEDTSILKYLITDKNEFIDEQNICALVGPTGIGKTTTIVKLMNRFVEKYAPKDIAIITTDYFDIAVKNQLYYYCNFFHVELAYANTADELTALLNEFKDKKLILIDTYGVSQRDTKNIDTLLQLLGSQAGKISTYLTLPCNVQEAILEEIAIAFKGANLKGCILTKQDESITLGAALCICIMNKLSVAYICNGPNIHHDIYPPVESKLLKGMKTRVGKEVELCE